jgi:hypothetical protein
MTWSELLNATVGDREVRVEIINPVRNGEHFKNGRLMGFKPGIVGGGHSNYRKCSPNSYDSSKRGWKKRPRVLVCYEVFLFRKSEICDWIDVDNCKFKLYDNTRNITPGDSSTGL